MEKPKFFQFQIGDRVETIKDLGSKRGVVQSIIRREGYTDCPRVLYADDSYGDVHPANLILLARREGAGFDIHGEGEPQDEAGADMEDDADEAARAAQAQRIKAAGDALLNNIMARWRSFGSPRSAIHEAENTMWELCVALDDAAKPPAPDPVDVMAEALWPWLRNAMPGCERSEWSAVQTGSAAHAMARNAAKAALAIREAKANG
jgi:hypothetical protein